MLKNETKSAEQKRHEDFVLGRDDLDIADVNSITERSAMKISVVYACVRTLL